MLINAKIPGGTDHAICASTFYTPQQTAALLSLHVVTVRKYLRCGIIRGRKLGNDWRILGANLLKLG